MITRRNFLQVAAATAAVTGLGAGGGLRRAAAQQSIRQEDLLRFESKGQLTILHMADTHAQLRPIYFREPSLNVGWYERAVRATRTEIDPQRVLLLDTLYTNNSRMLAPRSSEASRTWAMTWMVWLQDLMVTYAFFL